MPETSDKRTRRGARKAPNEGKTQRGGVSVRPIQEAGRSFAGGRPVERLARAADKAPGTTEADEAGGGKLPSKYAGPSEAEGSDPHTEENLDSGLDETFPASDPVSISRGAD